MSDPQSPQRPPGLLDVVRSVLASFFGVQSERNRERDFTRGKPQQYILVGLFMTLLFVLLMIGVVMLILRLAAP
jgi:hypothetical protein